MTDRVRPSLERVVLSLIVAGALVAGIGCQATATSAESGSGARSLRGVLVLHLGQAQLGAIRSEVRDGSCYGTSGFRDFGAGMNVTVRDGTGKVIGTDRTRAPSASPPPDLLPSGISGGGLDVIANTCTVWFEVAATEADFYQLEVGQRVKLTLSRQDLERQAWTLRFDLGR